MSAIINTRISRPDKKIINGFKKFPTTIVSDCLNRMNAMHSGIKPVVPGSVLVGPAITVQAMPGCNIMSHKAIYLAKKGDVIVIDGRGHTETAIWGGVQTLAARSRGIAGIVVDGAIRDSADALKYRFPIFCRAVTCAGPHKGWNDNINVPISCAGVSVAPGDIVIGDSDGVCVVPQKMAAAILSDSAKRLKMESEWIRKVKKGIPTTEFLGLDKKMKADGVIIR